MLYLATFNEQRYSRKIYFDIVNQEYLTFAKTSQRGNKIFSYFFFSVFFSLHQLMFQHFCPIKFRSGCNNTLIQTLRRNAKTQKKENCVFYTALISVLQKKIKKGRTKLIRRFGFFFVSLFAHAIGLGWGYKGKSWSECNCIIYPYPAFLSYFFSVSISVSFSIANLFQVPIKENNVHLSFFHGQLSPTFLREKINWKK